MSVIPARPFSAICIPGLAWESVVKPDPSPTQSAWTGAYTTMPNGKVLLLYQEVISAGSKVNTVEFDPVTVTYSAPTLAQLIPSPATQLTEGKLVALSDGTILACISAGGSSFGYSYTYDRGTDSWSSAIRTPNDFGGFGLVTIDNGDTALKFGGRLRSNGLFYGNVESYDVATSSWVTLTEVVPLGLRFVVAVTLSDGRVLVGGGQTYPAVTNYRYWFYEPTTGVFTETTSVPSALYIPNITDVLQLANGKVFMSGGRILPAVLFDPATESWSRFSIDSPIFNDYAISKLPDNERLLITGPTCHILTTC